MEYVVDLQGFQRSPNTFILKEAAIVTLQEEDTYPNVYHFLPPCEWKQLYSQERCVNGWLEDNFHGIPWSSGVISYEDHPYILRDVLMDARIIYVKGLEKQKWLESVLLNQCNVFNMDDIDCPSVKRIPKDSSIICNLHPLCWDAVCAVKHAYALKNWLLNMKKNRTVVDMPAGYDETDCAQ